MLFCFLSIIHSLIDDHILVSPYVDGKGISSTVNFYGDYSVLSYGGDQHIKLGFMSPHTAGALCYRKQVGQDKFVMEFKVKIEDLKKGEENNGMLIFFSPTDKVEMGSFYGIKSVEGFSVALDIKNGMDILVKTYINNKIQSTHTYRFFDDDDVTVRIIQGDNLKVELDDTYEVLVAYESDKYFIKKESFMGVSASNGSSSSASFSLRSIQPSTIQVVPKFFERGEREGSSKMTWFVFIIGSCGIMYYLYSKQVKKDE